MRYDILPRLVNGPEGDPAMYAEFKYERRALLFDMGDLHDLSARSLLKVTHVFVSHTHVDHFIGFDQMLRLQLGRGKTLFLYGPPGFSDHVEARLQGYSWNLVKKFPYDFRLEVYEAGSGSLRAGRFLCQEAFSRTPLSPLKEIEEEKVILDEPGLLVEAVVLEHDIPCLGYALKEKQHINVDKVRLEALGLQVGPWVRSLKEAVRKGASDQTPVTALISEERGGGEEVISLGELRSQVLKISRGQKIAYVTDAAFSEQNRERIIALARDADIFFCEAAFSEKDLGRAQDRRHLTAYQAGVLAREARAKRLILFHFSPKYSSCLEELYHEAGAAFGRAVE